MSIPEWDSLPWWEAKMLLEGLQEQKIIGGNKAEEAGQNGKSPAAKPAPTLDLTAAPLGTIGGFTTRRAG